MTRFKMTSLAGLLFLLVVFFQNCAEVGIQDPGDLEAASYGEGLVKICVDADSSLESFYITNLNTVYKSGRLSVDSDSDGLADSDEELLGSQPANRRSSSRLLDTVCKNVNYNIDCKNITLRCNGFDNNLGINDCDLAALGLDTLAANGGYDSDGDGIFDLLELRAGTFPNIHDANEDYDKDLKSNQTEILIGSNAWQTDLNINPAHKLLYTRTKETNSNTCSGDLWTTKVENIPLLRTIPYLGPETYLHHEADENIILFSYKTRSKINPEAPAEVYTKYLRLNLTFDVSLDRVKINLGPSDFNLTGRVGP